MGNKRRIAKLQKAAGEAVQTELEKRMQNLANELVIAGLEILKEEYGFDEKKLEEFLKKWLTRAKQNREGKPRPAKGAQ